MGDHEQPVIPAVREVANSGEDQDGNKLGVAAGMIWGLKKSIFNSVDYGVVVIPSYAVAH